MAPNVTMGSTRQRDRDHTHFRSVTGKLRVPSPSTGKSLSGRCLWITAAAFHPSTGCAPPHLRACCSPISRARVTFFAGGSSKSTGTLACVYLRIPDHDASAQRAPAYRLHLAEGFLCAARLPDSAGRLRVHAGRDGGRVAHAVMGQPARGPDIFEQLLPRRKLDARASVVALGGGTVLFALAGAARGVFRRRLWLVAALLLAAPPLRVLFWTLWGPRGLEHPFPVVMDALAAGCALAMIEPQWRQRDAWLRSRWFLLIPAITALLPLLQVHHNRIYQVAGLTAIHIGIALFVARAVRMQSRALNWGPVVWLGTLSYSFYLWQQPFLNRGSNTWWTAFPQNLVLALVCAMGSYYGVEKPFLELQRKQRAAVGRGKRRVASERGRVSAREIA